MLISYVVPSLFDVEGMAPDDTPASVIEYQ